MVNFGYFEQKGEKLIRVPEASSEYIPIPPAPGEKPWVLLCWFNEEPPSSMDFREAERRGLIF